MQESEQREFEGRPLFKADYMSDPLPNPDRSQGGWPGSGEPGAVPAQGRPVEELLHPKQRGFLLLPRHRWYHPKPGQESVLGEPEQILSS